MRKAFLSVFAAVVLCLGVAQLASATNRGVVYPGQNPDALQSNQDKRYQRLADGTVLRDLLGILNITGAWSSIAVVGVNQTGPYVQVVPSSSPAGQAGMLYQVLADDPSPVPNVCPTGFPCSGYQLNADSTQIVVPALINAASANIGPLTCNACTAGQATSYLIEAQIQTQPGNNRSMMFVSTSGAVSFPNVNTEVDDTVAYASVQGGTAAYSTTPPSPGASPNPTPAMPSPAPGWVPLAFVQIYYGTSNCFVNGCTINMAYTSQFQQGTYNAVYVGGEYARNDGSSPTKLTTQNFSGCGLGDGLGLAVDNASAGNGSGFINTGNHEFRVDQLGNVAVCGQKLWLFAQNGNNNEVPEIISNTNENQASGTPSPNPLYPASGSATASISGSCSNNTFCNMNAGAGISPCKFSGSPSAMFVSGPFSSSYILSTQTISSTPTLVVYNVSGGSITGGTNIFYQYVCL